jgi:hypothetical protein
MAPGDPSFLDAYTEDQVFDGLLRAFAQRLASQKNPQFTRCSWAAVLELTAHELTPKDAGAKYRFNQMYEYQRHQHVWNSDNQKMIAAAWRFVLEGTARPILGVDGDRQAKLDGLIFTSKGLDRLRRVLPDGPGRPGYLSRITKANPEVDEQVFARLQDAQACLDANLHRPAIVMMGIAAEVTTEAAYGVLSAIPNAPKARARKFREQLDLVRKAVPHMQNGAEEKHRLLCALDAIETVRVLRNDAAHPGEDVPDHYVATDRFGSMCLHLPVVWNILVRPNRAPPDPLGGS